MTEHQPNPNLLLWRPYSYTDDPNLLLEDRYPDGKPPKDKLLWVFDTFYEGVTIAEHDGFHWVGANGSDDIGVTHWAPMIRPGKPQPSEKLAGPIDGYMGGGGDETNITLRTKSGRVNDTRALVSFLYELGRDHLPLGTVQDLVNRNEMVGPENEAQFTNGHLAGYAQYLADRLGVKVPTEDWAVKAVDQHTREMWRIANLMPALIDRGAAMNLRHAVKTLRDAFELPELEGM